MKRLVALALSLAMLLCLCACAKETGSGAETASEKVPEETISEERISTEEALSAGEDAENDTTVYNTESWDKITLTVAIADGENDYYSKCFRWFAEQIESRSNGKIDFNVFYGGTYCSLPEAFDNVSSGAVDMSLWNQSINSDVMPFTAFTGLANGNKEALDMTNYMVYENPETAAVYEKYASANNIKMLGYLPAGTSLFCARSEIKSFEDFAGITFGTMLNASLWESLGFNVVSCAPSDMYESLSRGVIDSACQALPSAIAKMFYEVTSYGLLTSYSATCFNLIINLDRWNSLSEDQQALFAEVMAELEPYSLDLYDDLETEWLDMWESATGNPVVRMSESDAQKYIVNSYQINYKTYSSAADTLGARDDFEIIVDAHNDYLGIDCRKGE